MSAAGQVLVVLAHPDDESFIIGGTLARLALAGSSVRLVCATRGEMGRRLGTPPVATRETLPVLREQELRAACAALGVGELHFMGLRDKTVDYYDPSDLAERLRPFFVEGRPDLVITFDEKRGGHSDHCAIGRAATLAYHRWAAPDAGLFHPVWAPEGAAAKGLAAVKVDGDAARRKLAAFRAHRTQSELMDWLWDDRAALKRLTGVEYFRQAGGSRRLGV